MTAPTTGAASPASDLTDPAADTRLVRAHKLVSSGRIRVLTLDVFDTLLWRAVPRPLDLFNILGRRFADRGWLHDSVTPDSFARIRLIAEAEARRRSIVRGDGPEVLLADVYGLLPESVIAGSGPDTLAAVELEVEGELSLPDLDIVQLAQAAGEHGVKVALVSNTYFTPEQLLRLVLRPGIELPLAEVFASSTAGCSKGDGLFERVLQRLAVAPDEVLHVGDDPDADVAASDKVGINAVLFPRLDDRLREIVEGEGVAVTGQSPQRPGVIDLVHGDYGLTSLRGKVLARSALDHEPPGTGAYWRYGVTTLGPPLAAFGEWVHGRARASGADRVFCMMREGEFLAALINEAGAGNPDAVPAETIWLSRYAAARAAIVSVTREELTSFLLRRRVRPTLGEFCAEVGVRLADIPRLRQHAATTLRAGPVADALFDELLGRPDLVTRIRDETAGARQRLAQYVVRTVGREDGVLALVDVGWGASIQWYLATALAAAGLKFRLVGLYLMSNVGAATGMLDGLEINAYLSTLGVPADLAQPIERSPEIIEQACLATTGSLLDFDHSLVPILDSSAPGALQTIQKTAVQHGVMAFVRERRRYAETEGGAVLSFDGNERRALLTVLRRSVTRPNADEAGMFADWAHEDNFGAQTHEPVVRRSLGRSVPYMTPEDLGRLGMSECYWPNGLAAMYDENLALATAAVAEGLVPAAAFASENFNEDMVLLGDCGGGVGVGKGPVAGDRRRVNANGLSYVRLTIEAPNIRAAVLRPGERACVVRFDWIRLTAWREAVSRDLETFIEDEAGFAHLGYGNCVRLYDGVIACPERPEVTLDVARLIGPGVWRLEVEAGFAVLPLHGTVPSIVGGDIASAVRARGERIRKRMEEEFNHGGATAVVRGGARWAVRRRRRR